MFGERKTPLKRTPFKRKASQWKRSVELNRKHTTPGGSKRSLKQVYFAAELDRMTPALKQRAGNRCEIGVENICEGTSRFMHRHHRRRRNINADGKANFLANLLLACPNCHEYIHRKRKWAELHGFIIKTHEDPELIPVIPVVTLP